MVNSGYAFLTLLLSSSVVVAMRIDHKKSAVELSKMLEQNEEVVANANDVDTEASCGDWCDGDSSPWIKKCGLKGCRGCQQCLMCEGEDEQTRKPLKPAAEECSSFAGFWFLNASHLPGLEEHPYPLAFQFKQYGCYGFMQAWAMTNGGGQASINGDTMQFCVYDSGVGTVQQVGNGVVEVTTPWNDEAFTLGKASRAPPSEGTDCADFSGTWDMWDCDEYGGLGGQTVLSQSGCVVQADGMTGVASGKILNLENPQAEHQPMNDPLLASRFLYSYNHDVILTDFGHCTYRRPSAN